MILLGTTVSTLEFWPILTAEFAYRKDQLFFVRRKVVTDVPAANAAPEQTPDPDQVGFGDLLKAQELSITPVSTEYGIVIEKINANAKIVADIDPGNEAAYKQALKEGVAEALGSTKPGEPGNLFLFSHSTDGPWNVTRYNALFYLLRELAPGDKVIVFYKEKRYDYVVFDKKVVKPTDISYLTNRYDEPILTLQTCDPPGTSLNRLIVRAKLAGS